MCLARNRDGANPLHVAAMRGKVEVLDQLLQANPHAARARVFNGGSKTILHLCIGYNQPHCLRILLEKYFKDEEFVNAKDNMDNTILHLAVADRSYEMVAHVLFSTKIDVNAINAKKQTAMDILFEKEKGTQPEGSGGILLELLKICDAKTARQAHDILDPTEIAQKRNGILVAAALMATLGFQAGMAPPGGVWQEDKDGHQSGKAVMASNYPILYSFFLCFNILGFISSLATLVLMITNMPFKAGRYTRWTFISMSTTITSIAIAYSISLVVVSPPLRRGPMIKTALAPAASVILLLLLIAIIAANIKRVYRAVERAVKSVEWAKFYSWVRASAKSAVQNCRRRAANRV
ncbi:ankyrin repeat-containing protein At2g01680-like [Rhododendron vialii]|uniref:ankyrin repeat-containing protein At2g01680-like n=1 Tax=Rhododendron vialii TaxID=182163 RepID=UPI00265FD91C|nr:ankyrin repeat-containing protein At2g01680-like [Rhododendron vialii]